MDANKAKVAVAVQKPATQDPVLATVKSVAAPTSTTRGNPSPRPDGSVDRAWYWFKTG
jgi:hypothetical protein